VSPLARHETLRDFMMRYFGASSQGNASVI
jgi:hypothetical protein